MSPPEHYGVEYEINPWMDRRRAPDRALAGRQWRRLRRLLESLGARIEIVEPAPGVPDMVFTANAGLVDGSRVILSNFRHAQRQPEAPRFAAWFEANGFEVVRLEEQHPFEGAGDALFVGDDLFAGYHFRSDIYSHELVSEILSRRVISLELADARFYHLDTCFCPLGPETVLYYPEAFDRYARQVIAETIPDRIEVRREDALRFGANAVVLGKAVIFNTGCLRLRRALRDRGWETHTTPLSEFIKAGGAARCLTLDVGL